MPGLSAITALAVVVHGYHLGVDDSAIYVPAIKRVADPNLYPFGAEFFMSHAHLSIFAGLVGGSARLTHLPIDTVIFGWHVATIFLLLLAAWQLLGTCFKGSHARWGGVAVLAATLSVPVTGTALAIMDPYLTARSLSTPASLFAVACYLSNRPRRALAWLLLTAAVHPQMAVYVGLFVGCMELLERRRAIAAVAGPVLGAWVPLPFLLNFAPVTGPARDCLLSRTFFFVATWTWYQWIGVFAPLALLWRLSVALPRHTLPAFRRVASSLIPFGLLFTIAAAMLAIPRLEGYNRLQPMRSFHLLYLIFFILLGGVIGEYWIKSIRVALGGAVCSAGTHYGAGAGVHFPGERACGVAGIEQRQHVDLGIPVDPVPHAKRGGVRARSELHGASGRGRARVPGGGGAERARGLCQR